MASRPLLSGFSPLMSAVDGAGRTQCGLRRWPRYAVTSVGVSVVLRGRSGHG